MSGPRAAHVGLNLIFLVPGETGGMEVYARELIAALLSQAPSQMRFTAFLSREAAVDASWLPSSLTAVTVPVSARRRAQWVLGEQVLLPALARRARVDLVHSLASTAPLWGAFRRVVTIHDLIYARFPEAHPGLRALGMRALVPRAARRSDRVIADSRSTRDDLVRVLGLDAERIEVIPLGHGTVARERPLAEPEVRTRLSLGQRPIALSLSAKRPHKNIAALIDALAQLPAAQRPLLVLPGYATWHERELRERALQAGVSEDVRMPGWISGAELEGLWAVAECFVFPSLYEGFGLPVLEAMARGVPVACSNASSLPEVAGEAALLFDPRDPAAIARALQRLLSDRELRQRLRTLGRERARQFTWQRTAQLTLACYERVLSGA